MIVAVIVAVVCFFIARSLLNAKESKDEKNQQSSIKQNIIKEQIPVTRNQNQMTQNQNPIAITFSNISSNQRMSIMNLLFSIAICDGEQGMDLELKYLNSFRKIINVDSNNSMAYLHEKGESQIIKDLNQLSLNQKELLIIICYEIICCDKNVNEIEMGYTIDFFEHIGISSEKLLSTIEKTKNILKNL